MQPNDSVHHETIRLVSLSFRLRSRMAAVLSITGEGQTGFTRFTELFLIRISPVASRSQTLFGNEVVLETLFPPAAKQSFARKCVPKLEFGPERREVHDPLIPLLHSWPDLRQRLVQSLAEKYLEMFVATGIGMIGFSHGFDARKMFAIAGAVAPQHNHTLACIFPRTPIPIGLMIADRFR